MEAHAVRQSAILLMTSESTDSGHRDGCQSSPCMSSRVWFGEMVEGSGSPTPHVYVWPEQIADNEGWSVR